MTTRPRASARLLLAALLSSASLAYAQPGDGDQVSVRYSHSADNALQAGSLPGGEVGVSAGFLEWRSSRGLTEATRLTYGVSWAGYDFQRSGPMAVPDRLQEIALDLGVLHRVNQQWIVIAAVQPGLYGDLEGGSSDAFNAPVMLLANFAQSRDLVWSFGLRADAFGENPVLPFLGVNWKFAPGWEFTIGYPRVGFGYEATPALKLGFGLTAQGGSFHVARDPREVSTAVSPRLDDTPLEYREIRVGLGAEYRLSESLALTAEIGAITDQKFDYHERNYTLDGGSAAFFTIGLTGRF